MFRLFIVSILFSMVSCDPSRIYETNRDFENGQWVSGDTAYFAIQVPDSATRYNLLLNVRNTIDFNTARLFIQYELSDSNKVIRKRLVEQNLFDRKTGEPFGESGLGDIFSHRFVLENGISFKKAGEIQIKLNHMMRTDTLSEIRSVGIRLERVAQ